MMRLHSVNTEQRLPNDLLRAALDGGGCAEALGESFPRGGCDRYQLMGVRMLDSARRPDDREPMLLQNLLSLRAESAGYTAIVTTRGDSVYALLNETPTTASRSSERVEALAHRAVAHAAKQLRTTLVAAVGHPLNNLTNLHTARAEVDRLTTMLTTSGQSVGTAEMLGSRAVLAELRELVTDRPHLLTGPIETLREIDATKGTEYLRTLRAYFDAKFDLSEAGKALCVHRNTVRYRIGRVQELCEIDIFAPTERLVLELQLSLAES
jgi:DNA-binding PucR family transcriptional regulator